jgi:hypothetical protein
MPAATAVLGLEMHGVQAKKGTPMLVDVSDEFEPDTPVSGSHHSSPGRGMGMPPGPCRAGRALSAGPGGPRSSQVGHVVAFITPGDPPRATSSQLLQLAQMPTSPPA